MTKPMIITSYTCATSRTRHSFVAEPAELVARPNQPVTWLHATTIDKERCSFEARRAGWYALGVVSGLCRRGGDAWQTLFK